MIKEFIDDLFRTRYFDKWLITRDDITNRLLAVKGENTFQNMILEVYKAYKSVYPKNGDNDDR